MIFLNPGFLWLFSILIPVFALYFIKSKPRHQIVSSNLIWQLVLNRINPNSFFQKFHNSIFLLLQTLAITLVVLALARPSGIFGGLLKRIIIIDVSASMSANDISPSRLEAAKNRAVTLCNDNREIALYLLTDNLMPLLNYGHNKKMLKETITQIHGTAFATPTPESILRELRKLDKQEPDEIFILTDTLNLDFPTDFMPQTALYVEIFGKTRNNVGITTSEASWDTTFQVMRPVIKLRNYNENWVNCSLVIPEKNLNGFPVVFSLKPNQETSMTLPPVPLKKFSISLQVPSDQNYLTLDDTCFFSEPKIRPRVLIAAPDNSILFRLSAALPMIEFLPYSPDLLPNSCAIIGLEGFCEINQQIPSCWFKTDGQQVREGEVLPYNEDHPLTRYTNWDYIPSEALYAFTMEGIPLVETVNGVLLIEQIVNVTTKKLSHIFVGLDIENPKLADNIFLPILLFNVIEYLLKDAFPRLTYPIGHPSLSLIFKKDSPQTPGFYTVPDSPDSIVAVNIQSPSECDIQPAIPQKPTHAQTMSKTMKEQTTSPWLALLSLAFVIFLIEWYAFIKRC